jgi:segregation and condensation protein B
MTMTTDELRAAIEAILFVSGEPVKFEELAEAFPDQEKETLEQQINEIESSFAQREGGFVLERAAGGFRFATRPDLDPHLRKYFSRKNEGRLSLAALETMAIVAYRQPITVPEINDIRGVNSSGVIRTLLDRKMIKIAGRKSVVGSPFLYRTTREFLVHFGLESIQDLPKLEEFSEILGESLADELLTSMSEEDLLDAPPAEEAEGRTEAIGSGSDQSSDNVSASEEETPPAGPLEAAASDALSEDAIIETPSETRIDDLEGRRTGGVGLPAHEELLDGEHHADDEPGERIEGESSGGDAMQHSGERALESDEEVATASTPDEDAIESGDERN